MNADPQLLTAIRLLQDRLTAHNLRGVRVTPGPGGMVEVRSRALPVGEFPGPQPGEDGVAWAERTALAVRSRFAPFR